jgi:hypothetical protein
MGRKSYCVGHQDELRKEALDTICSLTLALGPDFAIFSSTIFKARSSSGCVTSIALHLNALLS